MTLKDIFDRYVRSPFTNNDYSRNNSDQTWDGNNENEQNNNRSSRNRNFNFSIGIDPSDMDDMFGWLDRLSRDTHHGVDNFPSLSEFQENGDDSLLADHSNSKSLRDQVLKQSEDNSSHNDSSYSNENNPDSVRRNFDRSGIDSMMREFFGRAFHVPFINNSMPQQDTDLDADVQQGGLDSVLKKNNHENDEHSLVPFKHNFSSRIEQSTIRKPDGSTEQRTTKRDSSGNTETTIITESPSGERRTEIRTSNGMTESYTDDSGDGVLFRDFSLQDPDSSSPFHSPHFDPTFPNINSFMKFFFSK